MWLVLCSKHVFTSPNALKALSMVALLASMTKMIENKDTDHVVECLYKCPGTEGPFSGGIFTCLLWVTMVLGYVVQVTWY